MISIQILQKCHQAKLIELANDPAIHATSGVPSPCNDQVVQAWINSAASKNPLEITFAVLSDGNLVGCCALKKIDHIKHQAELSYWVGKRHWGRGIGGTAARLLRDEAFTAYSMWRLHAHFLKYNNAHSGRILKSSGFSPDPCQKDIPTEGRFRDAFEDDVWTFVELHRESWLLMR